MLLADSGARMLVVQPATQRVGDESAAALPGCEVVGVDSLEWSRIGEAGAASPHPDVQVSDDARALFLFTAGTSGRPKGAMLTHSALRANIDMKSIPNFMWLNVDDVVAESLADVAKGQVVSVPGLQYKALITGARLVPRGLVRALTKGFGRGRDRT